MIEKMLVGYLEAARWADAPEGSLARFPKSEIEKARADCLAFIAACGPLVDKAVSLYSAEQFGCDFWLTRCGHGVGFWDRHELDTPAGFCVTYLDRDGRTFATDPDESLGDALTAIAYGRTHISKFAYASLSAYRGWLYFEG